MSDHCHKPTLTFENGAYNATQVRLYGIKQNSYVVSPANKKNTTHKDSNTVTTVSIAGKYKDNNNTSSEVKKLRDAGKSEEDIYRDVLNGEIKGDESFLSAYSSWIVFDLKSVDRRVDILATSSDKKNPVSCGVIVGYSYEGHCYDLPKPKIMLIPAIPQRIPLGDCAYHDKYDPTAPEKYMLWIVDKLDECVEFEMNQGFVEQIVLEANLPGKRSPTMYASRMMMGHRGGRLSES
ncbi:hypothetical protein RB623_21255 [Mesorhizobium sp. LHD-90]|uniref:hypothetical protein n=1 Tax=Mesorhizobium sp. LHD-90 TaxID=3071414 RepID=UPI0027E00C40|nr:hypothetical protein [Mesorhizobium sp. LHD-90]MDQ6436586.1 hypothetical protein [Mesorhizobium sp. LHD-90]